MERRSKMRERRREREKEEEEGRKGKEVGGTEERDRRQQDRKEGAKGCGKSSIPQSPRKGSPAYILQYQVLVRTPSFLSQHPPLLSTLLQTFPTSKEDMTSKSGSA